VAPARAWRITDGFTLAFPFVPVAVVVLAVVVVVVLAATGGIALGKVFSAVVSVAGFLSAPGAADRGVISAPPPAAAWVAAGTSLFQRFVTIAPATALSATKPASAA
jgi:hypothetical protein